MREPEVAPTPPSQKPITLPEGWRPEWRLPKHLREERNAEEDKAAAAPPSYTAYEGELRPSVPRTRVIFVCTVDQKTRWETRAKKAGIPFSQWIRRRIGR